MHVYVYCGYELERGWRYGHASQWSLGDPRQAGMRPGRKYTGT